MISRKQRRKGGFLGQYRIDDAYLRRPDRSTGRVGLWEGTGPYGQPALIKVWPRSARQDDADLEEIWRHEIRQLHRMNGHPVVHDVIARLSDAGFDADGFYLVLEPSQRRPLAVLLDRGLPTLWLKQPRLPRNRLRIWQNVKRLACALEALHSEGMLHRDLDAWSVLTSGAEDDADFQLTGFEWSMRLANTAGKKSGINTRAGMSASFRGDWSQLAQLIATLIGAQWSRVQNLAIPAFEVADHLFAAEIRLLRNLAGIELLDRLDGDVVATKIDAILATVASDAAGKDAKLNLVLDLRPESPICREVARHLGTDPRSLAPELPQIIEADLGEGVQLIGVRKEGSDVLKLVLRGHDFWYRLAAYRPPKATQSSWEYAFCDSIGKAGPAPLSVVGTIHLPASAIEPLSVAEAPAKFARGRRSGRGWEALRTRLERSTAEVTDVAIFQRALTLTLIVELLFAVAETFPVALVETDAGLTGGGQDEVIYLVARGDADRNELAETLGLKSPDRQLWTALTGDGIRREGWTLTTAATLGERNPKDTDWKFEGEVAGERGRSLFRFTGSSPPPKGEPLFLIPEDAVGRDSQLRRRLKALAAFREHLELQRVLTNPKAELMMSHDRLPPDNELTGLDDSKQEAVRSIIQTLPMFLVQGPPGVGKTRLVRELVRLRFSAEPSLRVLLSAQSNAAVDHLLEEIRPAVAHRDPPPLMVRSRSGREGEDGGDFDIGKVSQQILAKIAASPLVADARPPLRDAFLRLERGTRTAAATATARGSRPRNTPGLRNFEGIVMRAANLVFTTTNSADLERLIEEHSQFDWSIIEEAGKATGSELIAPQLLSHRRLMIGDHKQLPPFNADQMIELLSRPEDVVRALAIGSDYIGRSLRDESTESMLDEVEEDEERAPELCARAIQAIVLFQSLIEEELARRGPKTRQSFATRLNEQHRMHPAIARVIGRTFYPDNSSGKLETHAKSAARFAKGPCPTRSLDPTRLPDVPIVLVDTGAKQKSAGKLKGELKPRWHNREERDAVAEILRLLRPTTGEAPTLAVLSPYAQQVKRLDDMLSDQEEIGPASLGFTSPSADGRFCFTVDGFQGSEADATIISLVRNNDHTNIRAALGFLAERRRMNVLLSRAKWRLILVGAFDFLEEVLNGARIAGTSAEIEFLGTLFDALAHEAPEYMRRINVTELQGPDE